MLTHSVTAVILAGGQAKRLGGHDKGLIRVGNQFLIEHLIAQLRPQVCEVIISANRNFEQYQQFDCRVVADSIGHYWGPLAGIASVMRVMTTEYLVTVPCDSPLLPEGFVEKLLSALIAHATDFSVAHDGERLQPLFALWTRQLLPSLEIYLETGNRKVRDWCGQHHGVRVDFAAESQKFININTVHDLDVLTTHLAVHG